MLRKPHMWRAKRVFLQEAVRPIGSVILLGLSLSVGGAVYIRWDQTRHILETLQNEAQARAHVLETQIEHNERTLLQMVHWQSETEPEPCSWLTAHAAVHQAHLPWLAGIYWVGAEEAHRGTISDSQCRTPSGAGKSNSRRSGRLLASTRCRLSTHGAARPAGRPSSAWVLPMKA